MDTIINLLASSAYIIVNKKLKSKISYFTWKKNKILLL